MSQLAFRFVILNMYLFALFSQSGELAGEQAVVRNQAKWPISQSLFETALFDFFSFKTQGKTPKSAELPKKEAVASKISAKQKPQRTLHLWWPPAQLEVVESTSILSIATILAARETIFHRTPHELFEILTI